MGSTNPNKLLIYFTCKIAYFLVVNFVKGTATYALNWTVFSA
jgi:hypothetical protein